jgi:prophage regulatory protein
MENNTLHVQSEIRCLRVQEFAKKLSIGVSTVWDFLKKDVAFPQPINLSKRVTVWYEHEVNEFVASKRGTVH